jgi:PleD family two-component response regulator
VKADAVNTLDAPPVQALPGARLALVMLGAERTAQSIGSCLQERGWQVIEAQSPRMGKAYLQAYRLELVVMEDSEPGREVLAEIHRLPGRERREMNCVLIGDRTASFDTRTAFVLGVNSYVHQDDSQGLETALDQAQDLFQQYRQLWMAAGDR